MARELLERGHDVTLCTNYPKWAVKRFRIPPRYVRSFVPHGILSRLAWSLHELTNLPHPQAWLHQMFGRWAAKEITKESWDIIVSWGEFSEELFLALGQKQDLKFLMWGSAHIRTQARLLEEEEKRTGVPIERPSQWMVARGEREFRLADAVIVLSNFSYNTFVAEGVEPEKLRLLPLGVDLVMFRPSTQAIEVRCRRILSGEPLHILYVGTLSFRKGMWDMAEIINQLDQRRFQFHFVGPIDREALSLTQSLRSRATFIQKQPQHELPKFYACGDIFLLPTIEDGFQIVLAQAAAASVPILTTPNGAGSDLVKENETGWVLPIRSPHAFVERLQWCDLHRKELAEMVWRIYDEFKPRDWREVAQDFEAICRKKFEKK